MSEPIRFDLGERAIELAPYKIGDLRRAAPILDRMNARLEGLDTLGGALEASRDMIEIIAIGAAKVDAALTADAIEEMLTFEQGQALQEPFKALLAASGLAPKGEALAPSSLPASEGAEA